MGCITPQLKSSVKHKGRNFKPQQQNKIINKYKQTHYARVADGVVCNLPQRTLPYEGINTLSELTRELMVHKRPPQWPGSAVQQQMPAGSDRDTSVFLAVFHIQYQQ
eukprot:735054-Amphidinium_carterae.1